MSTLPISFYPQVHVRSPRAINSHCNNTIFLPHHDAFPSHDYTPITRPQDKRRHSQVAIPRHSPCTPPSALYARRRLTHGYSLDAYNKNTIASIRSSPVSGRLRRVRHARHGLAAGASGIRSVGGAGRPQRPRRGCAARAASMPPLLCPAGRGPGSQLKLSRWSASGDHLSTLGGREVEAPEVHLHPQSPLRPQYCATRCAPSWRGCLRVCRRGSGTCASRRASGPT